MRLLACAAIAGQQAHQPPWPEALLLPTFRAPRAPPHTQLFGTYDYAAAPGMPMNATTAVLDDPGETDPFQVWALVYDLPADAGELGRRCDAHAAGVLRSLVPAPGAPPG